MTAVWMRARNELRRRWRGLISLALIAGIGGGAAIAAVAGARRTESAYPRFLKATNAFDSFVGLSYDNYDPKYVPVLEAAGRLPIVKDYTLLELFLATVTGPNGVAKTFPEIAPTAGPDGKLGHSLNAVKILAGRVADNSHADEAMLNPTEAQHFGAHVGSTITIDLFTVHKKVPVRVVGIGLIGSQIDPSAGGYLPMMLLTRAFYKQYGQAAVFGDPGIILVTLRGGRASLPILEQQALALDPHLNVTTVTIPQDAAAKRSALFQEVGLYVFGGLAALTILAIFAQLLTRQILLDTDEQDALRALGMTRTQMVMLSLMRIATVGAAAGAISAVVAIALSPIFPTGFVRQLEVSPGVRVDLMVVLLGAIGTLVLIVLAGVVPAWKSTISAIKSRPTKVGTNRAINALARVGLPPTAVSGVRMALEPGHGSTSVPVRTTIFGTALALIALTASLAFGASIHTLVGTPRLSGWNFDAIVGLDTAARLKSVLDGLVSDGTIASVVYGDVPDLQIGGIVVSGLAFEPGSFGPTIISGRMPDGPNEVALGLKMIRRLHSAIGQTVQLTPVDQNTDRPAGTPISVRIVGSTITPQFFFSQTSPGNSAVFSEEFVRAHAPPDFPLHTSAYVRFTHGVSVEQGVARINAATPGGAFVIRRSQSSDLTNLQRISGLPSILAALLALVAAGTLAHTLISSVRRRRSELATLRALGFLRRQVRLTVAWQATTIIIISLAIGLPVGAIAGRWGWRVFIDQLGYLPLPIVPLLSILLAIPVAVVVANLIASIPARAAARIEPAVAVRAE
jgi:ABC-type antimicrobial peptide transport system permease subunit